MRLLRRRRESLDVVRHRIIRETEAALLYGLNSPDHAIRIPTVEVGKSRFNRVFAVRFWAETLGIEETDQLALDPSEYRRSTSGPTQPNFRVLTVGEPILFVADVVSAIREDRHDQEVYRAAGAART